MSEMQIFEIMNKYSNSRFDKRYDGQYGIEIETESLEEYAVPSLKYWRVDRDNSLRHFGIEYILKAPMTYQEVPMALKEWDSFAKKVKFIPDSHSTSVHVHINFLNEKFLTMANFFATWALIENLMIKFSGPDRLSNLFCLPIKDAEGINDNLVHLLKQIEAKAYKRISLHSDTVKYGAINPGPFTSLGSIEIRSFRGEMSTELQYQWVTLLDKIMQFSRTEGLTPPAICDMFKVRGHSIVGDIFGSELERVLRGRMSPSEVQELLITNIKYSARIAAVSNKWPKFGVILVKKVYKEHLKKQLDEMAAKYNSSSFDNLSYHMQLIVMEEYHKANPSTRIVEAQEDI